MSQKILIIDDSIPQHKLIKTVLREQAVEFESAYGGKAGLALATSSQPDLILLDVDMIDMNGFEVCRMLKFNPATSAIPVIFLTVSATIDEKIYGIELQAVDYVHKPFDPEELRARVRVALRIKRLLDLLPTPIEGLPEGGDSTEAKRLNARLSLAQLTRARSENPWQRVPPLVAESTTAPDKPRNSHNINSGPSRIAG
jgi:putative two-component system response regulator